MEAISLSRHQKAKATVIPLNIVVPSLTSFLLFFKTAMGRREPQIKALSTHIRFHLKTQIFFSVFKNIYVHTIAFSIVFESLSSVHTNTQTRFENDNNVVGSKVIPT